MQCKRPCLDERGRIDHPDRLGALAERCSGQCDLRSYQGGPALVCAHLDGAELAGKGIRGNVIAPAQFETPILEGQFGENTDAMKQRFTTMIPMGRIGKPEEIASAAVFLASAVRAGIVRGDKVYQGLPFRRIGPPLKCPLYFAVGMEEGLDGIADMLPELSGSDGFRSQSKNRPANLSSQKEALKMFRHPQRISFS